MSIPDVLAAIEQAVRVIVCAGVAIYIFDHRRRAIAQGAERADQARRQRAMLACVVAAVRVLRRAEAQRERAVIAAETAAAAAALAASLETRRFRAPRERRSRPVGFAP